MFNIDFGNLWYLSFGTFNFRSGRGRGGIPFSAFSIGSLGMRMGLNMEISSPLLQMGQVRYYWLERSQW